ncbi:Hypothetical predicted protein [Lecanosticta acicola]|uniref:Uncharacterized protein n=1 Tax=Lecanosticta acicola TaxID=111012 RepID=A0AAI9EEE7_9PEZI|nr:Hypothetical predicted protein [Lecanosticta acicola]
MSDNSRAKRRNNVWKGVKKALCGSRRANRESRVSAPDQDVALAKNVPHVERFIIPSQVSESHPSGISGAAVSNATPLPKVGIVDSWLHNAIFALADLAVAAPVYALDEGVWRLSAEVNGRPHLFKEARGNESHNKYTASRSKTPDDPPRIHTPEFGREHTKDTDSGHDTLRNNVSKNVHPAASTESWETVASEQQNTASRLYVQGSSREQSQVRPPLRDTRRKKSKHETNAQGGGRGATWWAGSVMENGIDIGPAVSGIGWRRDGRQISHDRLDWMRRARNPARCPGTNS